MDRRRAIGAGALMALQPALFAASAGELTTRGSASNPNLQAELDRLAAAGGGTLRISSDQIGGQLEVKGRNIAIEGDGHTLFDTRISIASSARQIAIRNLTFMDRTGRDDTWHLDVSGHDCLFENIRLIKQPSAAGYQAYFRAGSTRCTMRGFATAGSNGIFVAGRDNLFESFDMSTPIGGRVGGDDAFAIKGAGSPTSNITIRNGRVHGFAAAVSIGSEVGHSPEHPGPGSVIGVDASGIEAVECSMLVFIKPGALIYDWRDGLVRDVSLRDLSLCDPTGRRFTGGIVILAGRGARVEGVVARAITIAARTSKKRLRHSAALDLSISPEGAPASIRGIDIQLVFDGRGNAGGAIDHIAKIEKANPALGSISDVTLDIVGRETRYGGIIVGAGLDDGVMLRRVRLHRVGLNPPASVGGGGIWADSRVRMGDVEVDTESGSRFGGARAPGQG